LQLRAWHCSLSGQSVNRSIGQSVNPVNPVNSVNPVNPVNSVNPVNTVNTVNKVNKVNPDCDVRQRQAFARPTDAANFLTSLTSLTSLTLTTND